MANAVVHAVNSRDLDGTDRSRYAACCLLLSSDDSVVPVSSSAPGAGWLRVTCPGCLSASVLHFNSYTHPATV